MAFEQPIFSSSLEAAADLTTHQFKFIKIDATGKAALANAEGETVYGVLQNEPNTGETATVMVDGVTKIEAGATIDEGDLIATNLSGTAKVASTANVDAGSASTTEPIKGSYVIGLALEPAASGELFAMKITHAGAVPGTNE